MKTLHLSIIVIACIAIIGIISLVLINSQPTNYETNKYVFGGDYKISNEMTAIFNGKPFFVSKADVQYYDGGGNPSHCVNFFIPYFNNPPNPSGFVRTIVHFPDGIEENLTSGYGGHPPNIITVLTKHENPQAGLRWYTNGSVNFLVGIDNPANLPNQESPHITTIIIPDGLENQPTTKNFEPRDVNVTIGTNNTVRWIHEGSLPIKIMSSEDDCYSLFESTGHYLDSAMIKKGESFNYTFTKVGKFRYISQWPWANGWVQVLS